MRHAMKMIGLVFVLAASACGGDDGDGLERFIGTWRATAGTSTSACPGYAPSTEPISGNTVWSPGVSSDLISAGASNPCPIMADVRGATASGLPGQTCSVPYGSGLLTVTYSGYTFAISADGETATENASGQYTLVAQGATVVCSFNGSGSYQKIGN